MHQALKELCQRYWEWSLQADPLLATYLGDMRYNDRMADVSAATLKLRVEEQQAFEREVDALSLTDAGDITTAALLRLRLQDGQDEIRHNFHHWVLDQLQGPQVWLLELLNYHPHETEADLGTLAARYRAFPRFMHDFIENLRAGVREGRTAPRIAHTRVLGQVRELLATPVKASALYQPSEAVERAVETSVYPAFKAFQQYLEADYPGREEVGMWAVPGGEEAYAFRVRSHTTTDLTPQQVHDLGLARVEALEEEMRGIARALGHTGDLASFRAGLKADCFKSRDELLSAYRATLTRVEAMLPQWFGRLPHSPCDIKAIETFREKDCIAAYYYPPSDDFSRHGVFYVNTYQAETRPRYNMDALTVHEAVPGHHLQIALAMEQGSLPDFRRHSFFTAYIEGWALYTERLADEMGVYQSPAARFGMLTFQIWRAARLVVDTGMHALRWTRQQAIDYFEQHVGLPPLEIENEIDRYIVMPGQALAYSVGMNEIQSLRCLAEQRLGSRFDIKGFHDEVLRHGALPLSVLRQLIEQFVEERVGVPS